MGSFKKDFTTSELERLSDSLTATMFESNLRLIKSLENHVDRFSNILPTVQYPLRIRLESILAHIGCELRVMRILVEEEKTAALLGLSKDPDLNS